jgi:hypothetical protein
MTSSAVILITSNAWARGLFISNAWARGLFIWNARASGLLSLSTLGDPFLDSAAGFLLDDNILLDRPVHEQNMHPYQLDASLIPTSTTPCPAWYQRILK